MENPRAEDERADLRVKDVAAAAVVARVEEAALVVRESVLEEETLESLQTRPQWSKSGGATRLLIPDRALTFVPGLGLKFFSSVRYPNRWGARYDPVKLDYAGLDRPKMHRLRSS